MLCLILCFFHATPSVPTPPPPNITCIISKGHYKARDALKSDLLVMCDNCKLYNDRATIFYREAEALQVVRYRGGRRNGWVVVSDCHCVELCVCVFVSRLPVDTRIRIG